MIYLDYSANTPADSRVLERFCEVERSCPGNANSRHQAGRDAKLVIDHATQNYQDERQHRDRHQYSQQDACSAVIGMQSLARAVLGAKRSKAR